MAKRVRDVRLFEQVKRLEAHKQTVNAICFDEAVEYIASCSDDGTVVVRLPMHPG
jgi:hypothetical protein